MPFDLPQTPESPQYYTFTESSKQVTSPRAHSLLTPAHSINGSVSSIRSEMYQNEGSKKRKRESDDSGDQNLKKAHLETSRLHLEDLHLDLGRKYKLCHTQIPCSTPDLTQDLLSLYGLENISKSVARTNPDGSKGVRLRKTYKNHIKDHQLSGNFDSVKRETDDPNTIYSMMTVPQDEWDIESTFMEETKNGMLDSVKQLMGKAFKMSRGVIPKSSWNSSILGDLAPSAVPVEQSRPAHNTPKTNYQQTNSGASKSGKLVGPRPKRSVKKRTYGDSSFEGYGEGYINEENREVDYVIGDGEGVSKKRHKKTSQNHNFQSASTRHNSYGPGMVGA